MPRRRAVKPQDPYPTTTAVDRRLGEIATILASPNLSDSYRARLRDETNWLLDRRVRLAADELLAR